MTDTIADLKPCPFCGGKAVRITLGKDDGPDNEGGDVICCERCQASSNVEFGFKENLVSNWNRRAGQSDLAAERDAALVRAEKAEAELAKWKAVFDHRIEVLRKAIHGGTALNSNADLLIYMADRLVELAGDKESDDFIKAARERRRNRYAGGDVMRTVAKAMLAAQLMLAAMEN